MAPGLFIVPIMINGKKEQCIIEAVQEAAVITTLQPKMSLLKTVVISLVEPGIPGIVMAIQEKERELVQEGIVRMRLANQEVIQTMKPKIVALIIGQMNINVQII